MAFSLRNLSVNWLRSGQIGLHTTVAPAPCPAFAGHGRWRSVAGSLLFMNKLSHLQGSILNNLIYFDDIEFHLLELIHLCQHL